MDVACEEPGRQVFFPARNLSASGIYLEASDPPSVGASLKMVLPLPPEGVFFRVRGRVVRHASAAEPDGFAVSFETPDERTTLALRAFAEGHIG